MTKTNGSRPKRILILCRDAFGERMSSPGIRARHMAEVLARELPDARVTLGLPNKSRVADDPSRAYNIAYYTRTTYPRLLWANDIIIAGDFPITAMAAFPFRTFVLDYYTIYFIEWLDLSHEMRFRSERKRNVWLGRNRRRIGAQLIQADFMLVANDRQKDYYIGAMIALGLIDPLVYDFDPGMHNLIEPAPHGIRPDPLPEPGEPAIRNVFPGVSDTDKVIIWNGGIVHWYDPVTLLQALAKIREHRDDVKVVFVGGPYPGLGTVGLGPRYNEAVEAAKELGLYDTHAFFELGWVPYERMKQYMLESDLAVCTYFNNLETHFSFRTRFVDVFWAELPLICTEGDVLADMVRDQALGIVVPERDPAAVATAIERLLDDRELYDRTKANIRENNSRMSWTQSFEHLVRFCKQPKSSALSKWRRTILLGGAWAQWVAHYAATLWIR